jgi:hypothetical protein
MYYVLSASEGRRVKPNRSDLACQAYNVYLD